MKQDTKQLDPPEVSIITDFYISVDNDPARSGSIYANGRMQALVYIHYSRDELVSDDYVKAHI